MCVCSPQAQFLSWKGQTVSKFNVKKGMACFKSFVDKKKRKKKKLGNLSNKMIRKPHCKIKNQQNNNDNKTVSLITDVRRLFFTNAVYSVCSVNVQLI